MTTKYFHLNFIGYYKDYFVQITIHKEQNTNRLAPAFLYPSRPGDFLQTHIENALHQLFHSGDIALRIIKQLFVRV
uniref:Uncharacterized protein n=1 Tax=Coccidioides posadasii RMSCC 3488 TaxID=454284 RepID=A0A0J6FSN1_COCPO|nr:hypothetical protein CPAG_08368 [Coccidioides posadasii RMSCC 3488]